MLNKQFVIISFVIVLLAGFTAGFAQAPQLMNYQGYLTDENGAPENGTRTIVFTIYSVPTGGTELWAETQSVTVTDGVFSVLLGSVTPIPMDLFTYGNERYLALTVGSDDEMTPRKLLVPVAYAFMAYNSHQLNGLDADAYVREVDGVGPSGGNVDLVAGTNITITPDETAHTVTIAASGGATGDNLGNHIATQNIRLDGHYLSGDGNSEGLIVYSSGNADFEGGDVENEDGYFWAKNGSGTPRGYIGGSSYGAYGNYGSGNFGYLGGSSYAVYGETGTGRGVYGRATGSGQGVYGQSSTGWAGYFNGSLACSGYFSKGSGSFKIDHPLDPENKYLYHSFVESPDMMNVYNGNAVMDAAGEAIVELPRYFEALNRDFRYQLTCIGGFAQVYIAEKISGNRFKIAGGAPGMEVSWQVTGVRQDAFAKAHPIEVEVSKTSNDVGKYLHPIEHGVSETRGIHFELKNEKEGANHSPE